MIPDWALLISFWLHMLASVVWLGSLAALALFVLPALRRRLPPADFAVWLEALNARLDPLGWFCLGVLTFTGLMQMTPNPNYDGLLSITNNWALAMFIKHIVFFAMVGVSAYLTWKVSPALGRAAVQRAKGAKAGAADQAVLARFQRLVALNLVLGLLVLAFTAMARIS
ncbi:MAG: CopD family protein [Anaerolineales bacterium]|nr:CopD family protein [Anaerolineales bacterium]